MLPEILAEPLVIIKRRTVKIEKKGFTLLELVIVVIILGILATLGFVQYNRTIEKSRTSEAKSMLSTIRSSEHGYKQQFGSYTSDMDALAIENIASNCPAGGSFFFSYSIDATTATATRCFAAGTGKNPSGPAAYTLTLGYDAGTFSGSDPVYY
jgi:prepilin-type N-terminal cleavage/methylation domain-containing protein